MAQRVFQRNILGFIILGHMLATQEETADWFLRGNQAPQKWNENKKLKQQNVQKHFSAKLLCNFSVFSIFFEFFLTQAYEKFLTPNTNNEGKQITIVS